jgi:hypothetical protein
LNYPATGEAEHGVWAESRGRAFAARLPDGQPPPTEFVARIRTDARSERVITIKAAVPLAVIGLVIEIYRLARG